MTLITIETTDPRDRKALELAATAATWNTTMNGAFLVPASDGKRTYVTTADTCSCEDNARGNRCKHRRAAAIYVALREASQPTPARKPVEAPSRFATMSEAELFARF
jgi:hypothetical protein